ncbi:DUF397 domain-containing protein [Streptomyces sp. 3MP-14]|uniref:DUF397 domain-containing protein n=1 Tax=Streptomyces mimosae TaxID=2586635 RepID=A0A5N6AAA8_9ACTN|nr:MULTISPECIES: DUF397 domain-containing protein [Streptomyces]KAB8165757.1 DUF397 domain-containing protein [Streptomyces mimosae]KAB8176146.1 DUF397 domain-containing protein [Streptomyces sp. 3MP-14]
MQADQFGWFKSSYSAQNGECVEARRRTEGGLHVRDSKRTEATAIAFEAAPWAAFAQALKADAFDVR